MSFTDQKPRVATAEDIKAPWSGVKNGKRFYCMLCGYHFQVGDIWRWVSGGKKHLLNLMVCEKCDGDDVLERWEKWWQDWEHLAKTKFRYIADRLDDAERIN